MGVTRKILVLFCLAAVFFFQVWIFSGMQHADYFKCPVATVLIDEDCPDAQSGFTAFWEHVSLMQSFLKTIFVNFDTVIVLAVLFFAFFGLWNFLWRLCSVLADFLFYRKFLWYARLSEIFSVWFIRMMNWFARLNKGSLAESR